MIRSANLRYNYNADDVWAAACAAQRINMDYIKFPGQVDENNPMTTNREIMDRLLADPSVIAEEDKEQGKVVRKYYQAYTFSILKGIKLSPFDNDCMLVSNRDTIDSNHDVALINCLPSVYEKSVKRDTINRKLENATGGFIGSVGDKMAATVEVLKSNFSRNWNTFYISGITDDDQAVFFSYKQNINVGDKISITGNVKAHRENITQLNRVKVK